MLPYQIQVVEKFVQMLQPGTTDILEIGSDIAGEVVSALAMKTGVRVTGINPSLFFPQPIEPTQSNTFFLNADGRNMPFPDNSFDAILSVATMEHVNGLDPFMMEAARVLRPGGLFYAEFCPIWSSALGHHVYAVAGTKEARFWKPGKNPIPDYAHLLWTPDEMREHLKSSPCSEELIDPIIQWIYYGDDINRCHFEDYIDAFSESPLILRRLHLGNDQPDGAILSKLYEKYGSDRNFICSKISVLFRKLPEGAFQKAIAKAYWSARRKLDFWGITIIERLRFVIGTVLFSSVPFLGRWYSTLLQKWRGV